MPVNDPMGVRALTAAIKLENYDKKSRQLAINELARMQREIHRLQAAASRLTADLQSASPSMQTVGPAVHALEATRDWVVSLVECQGYISYVFGEFDANYRVQILSDRAVTQGRERARKDMDAQGIGRK